MNKEKKKQEVLESMRNLTNRVDEKLQFKQKKLETEYYNEWEKNILKRAKMEEKKKV